MKTEFRSPLTDLYVLVIYGLLAVESGAYIDRADMSRLCLDWESGYLPNSLAELFISGERVPLEQFSTWIDKYPEVVATFKLDILTMK